MSPFDLLPLFEFFCGLLDRTMDIDIDMELSDARVTK
jgi:hypothetical protein